MEVDRLHLAYFSATGTTEKIVVAIKEGIHVEQVSTWLLENMTEGRVALGRNELAVFAVPVYSGRVPNVAKEAIEKMHGDKTPAIIVCVYGNRDFDDALLELKDLVEKAGFVVISAAAFVAQHSIFPKVANGRPDEEDLALAKAFGANSMKNLMEDKGNSEILVRGNYPYREPKSIPLFPETDKNCILCGLCAKQCPMGAILADNPKKIDQTKCIACARCISVCPTHSKSFGGILYKLASIKFAKDNSRRQEPYIVYR